MSVCFRRAFNYPRRSERAFDLGYGVPDAYASDVIQSLVPWEISKGSESLSCVASSNLGLEDTNEEKNIFCVVLRTISLPVPIVH